MTQGTSTAKQGHVGVRAGVEPEAVLRILEEHPAGRGRLIAVLEGIQAAYSYLPEAALRIVADRMGRSLVDVYGVATFYRSFSLYPRGKHLVSVCLGTACHVRGAPMVAEEFERQLGVRRGGTTPDGEFTLETVNCLGACALGPIVVVDGHYFPNVALAQVRHIVAEAREGLAPVEEAAEQAYARKEQARPWDD